MTIPPEAIEAAVAKAGEAYSLGAGEGSYHIAGMRAALEAALPFLVPKPTAPISVNGPLLLRTLVQGHLRQIPEDWTIEQIEEGDYPVLDRRAGRALRLVRQAGATVSAFILVCVIPGLVWSESPYSLGIFWPINGAPKEKIARLSESIHVISSPPRENSPGSIANPRVLVVGKRLIPVQMRAAPRTDNRNAVIGNWTKSDKFRRLIQFADFDSVPSDELIAGSKPRVFQFDVEPKSRASVDSSQPYGAPKNSHVGAQLAPSRVSAHDYLPKAEKSQKQRYNNEPFGKSRNVAGILSYQAVVVALLLLGVAFQIFGLSILEYGTVSLGAAMAGFGLLLAIYSGLVAVSPSISEYFIR